MRDDVKLQPWSLSTLRERFDDDFCESVFFSGNGRMGVRGYLPYDPTNRPVQTGLFVAGIFDEIKPGITDFVNLPTPVWEQIVVDGEVPVLTSGIEQLLDLSVGLVRFEYTLSAAGKRLKVKHSRFFPPNNPALLVQRTELYPESDMEIVVESGIHTACCNCPVPDDQVKENSETVQLTKLCGVESERDGLRAVFRTTVTKISIEQQLSFRAEGFVSDDTFAATDAVGRKFVSHAAAGNTIVLDKLTAVLTSRDKDPYIELLPTDWSYCNMLEANKEAWQQKWNICDVELEGDDEAQAALRYAIYQMVVNCSANDDTVNIGARGLTHTRYKGCYFWDTDLFMVPFYLYTNPAAARSLLQYRVNMLPQARAHAAKMNNSGARYPWMASYDGSEQCESWDIGASEVHVTADIVYAMEQYRQITGDEGFYTGGSVEVYVETARYWCSRYSWDRETGEVNLLFCKGPDEYCGITNNNLFTNVMVKHNLALAESAADWLKINDRQMYAKLGIAEQEVASWGALRQAIKLPRDAKSGRWRTDDTFHLLESVPLEEIKKGDSASYHQVCFDRVQRYKVVKQADVLLLMSRFPEKFSRQEKLEAWEDFEPLCLHDSTLSFASHALFAAQNGLMADAEKYLGKALFLDIKEIMGNTGKEGLHMANFGEAWQAVILGVAGLFFAEGKPMLTPHLLSKWKKLRFKFFYKGDLYSAEVDTQAATASRIIE